MRTGRLDKERIEMNDLQNKSSAKLETPSGITRLGFTRRSFHPSCSLSLSLSRCSSVRWKVHGANFPTNTRWFNINAVTNSRLTNFHMGCSFKNPPRVYPRALLREREREREKCFVSFGVAEVLLFEICWKFFRNNFEKLCNFDKTIGRDKKERG